MRKTIFVLLALLLTLAGCGKETLSETSSVPSEDTHITSPTEEETEQSTAPSSEPAQNTEVPEETAVSTAESGTSDSSVKMPKQNTAFGGPTEPTEKTDPAESTPPATEPTETTPTVPNASTSDAGAIAELVAQYLNDYRTAQGTAAVTRLSGLTGYAEYRSRQIISDFSHNTMDERAAATALSYGMYVDPSVCGMAGEPYYTACAGEAIAKAGYAGTVDYVASSLARLIRNSPDHWSYIGSGEYRYIGVGITYESGMWYCDVALTKDNYG